MDSPYGVGHVSCILGFVLLFIVLFIYHYLMTDGSMEATLSLLDDFMENKTYSSWGL